ncbi:MAG: T9SS type A sorting domain-containing protein [Bacteroidota bacterium]
MPRFALCALLLALASTTLAPASAGQDARASARATEAAKLTASDGAARDRFGVSVSVSGTRALVGAFADEDAGDDAGSAYVFERVGGTWTETAKLTASDAAAGDVFGISVALDGTRAIVGAESDDGASLNQGSAYIFERVGGTWTETAKLTASDAAQDDGFGHRVAISGTRAIVGVFANADAGVGGGSAYVFEVVGGTWTQTARLTASDESAAFGRAVAIDGTRAVVSDPFSDDEANNAGSVYVFDLVGGTWTETAKVSASDAAADDLFGEAIALDGSRILVGAANADVVDLGSGRAYVFDLVAGTWTETAKLVPTDAARGDDFGNAVALQGDRAVIGALFDDDDGFASGGAYVFERAGGAWSQTTKLDPSDGASRDEFGRSVALDAGIVLVSASADDDRGADSGSVYVFSDAPTTTEAAPTPSVMLDVPRPNPASGLARVTYALAAPASVEVAVVDLLGRTVAVLASGPHPAGRHETAIPGTLAPGVYVARLRTGAEAVARRFSVVR